MSEPTEILPGVFVGDQFTAANADFFNRNRIVRVVNCTPTIPFYFPNKARYMRIPIDDSSDDLNNHIMASYMLPAIRFVLEIEPSPNRGVLIHCHAGISRSCTIAVAVLRFCCAPSIDKAIKTLVSKRRIAFFNGMYYNFSKALYLVFSI